MPETERTGHAPRTDSEGSRDQKATLSEDHATVDRTSRLSAGCGTIVGDDDAPRVEFCTDETTCGRSATRIVEVGGVEIAACGTHDEDAAEIAAERAGVDLVEAGVDRDHDPDEMPEDPMNRDPDDYEPGHHDDIQSDETDESTEGRRVVTDGGWSVTEPVDHDDLLPLDMANNIDDERVLERITWIDGFGRAYADPVEEVDA